jgi:MYXO-CTERM domain-containing protein
MTSPAFPICDAEVFDEPTMPQLIGEGTTFGVACSIRVLSNPPVFGGIRYEHWRSDAQLDEALITTTTAVNVATIRHECDGTETAGSVQVGVEYGHAFPDAIDGDVVVVYAGEQQLGVISLTAQASCPALDFEPQECQVCGPEGSVGCSVGGDGLGFGVLIAVALALGCRRRAR